MCTKHVLPYMMKKKSGSIVNFSSIYAINKIVADHYYSFFMNNPSSEATNYLKERGIEGKTVKDFLIGFSENNQTQLLNALLKQFSEKDILTSGTFLKNDKGIFPFFRNRIMFPINNIKGNIIIGIIAFSIIAWVTGLAKFNGVVSSPPPMTYLFDFDLKAALSASMSTVVFTLLFIDFFDTAGTLTSVANVAGKVDSKGRVTDINKAMMSDSVATVAGAMMGTTTVTSYVESGAGVKAGGRTGMTSLVIGILFLSCLFS